MFYLEADIFFKMFDNLFKIFKTSFPKKSYSLKNTTLKFAKFILLTEISFFISSYVIWKQMNESQEFRYYMRKNYPLILEG